MMKDRPLDLIPQREAAALVGKTLDTIRRWKRLGKLKGYPGDPGNPTAPGMVSKSEVMLLAARLGESSEYSRPRAPAAPPRQVDDVVAAQLAHIESLRGQVADLQQQRAELQSLVDLLSRQVEQLQGQLADKAERVAVLEREMHGGLIRGLLTGAQNTFSRTVGRFL